MEPRVEGADRRGWPARVRWLVGLCLLAALLAAVAPAAPAAARSSEVLLEGFHWRSSEVAPGWFEVIAENAGRIADSGFTMVWFPPVSRSADPQGYMPNEWYSIAGRYGDEAALRRAIRALRARGVKSMADVVINHRVGTTDFADFTRPTWPTHTIVADDEWSGPRSIHADTGEGTPYARDLDHQHPVVHSGVIAFLEWLRNDLGFAAWRYDMVKGYTPWAVKIYDDAVPVDFVVGEYFSGNPQEVVSWIDGTHVDWWKRAAAFDFPLREQIRQAVWGNYDHLNFAGSPPGVLGLWPDRSVVFVENHDLEEVRGKQYGEPFPDGPQTVMGYAYVLTHPGTPCVFWPDVFDAGASQEASIREMIAIRRQYGIHSESPLYIAKAVRGDGYAAYVRGDHGEIAVKIGPGSWSPSGEKWSQGNELLASGTDWAIWGEHGRWW